MGIFQGFLREGGTREIRDTSDCIVDFTNNLPSFKYTFFSPIDFLYSKAY